MEKSRAKLTLLFVWKKTTLLKNAILGF